MRSMRNPDSQELEIEFTLIENLFEGPNAGRFLSQLRLTNNSSLPLTGKWSLYFNFLRGILSDSVQGNFHIHHINGDFYSLEPKSPAQHLAPHGSTTISFISNNWVIKESDRPSGFYIIYRDERGQESKPQKLPPTKVMPFTRPEQTTRSRDDIRPIPTPQSRYQNNHGLSLLPKEQLPPLYPTPSALRRTEGSFALTPQTRIASQSADLNNAIYFSQRMEEWFGTPLPYQQGEEGEIVLKVGDVTVLGQTYQRGAEAYTLTITPKQIEIVGTEEAGVFYGLQSLVMLLDYTKVGKKPKTLTVGCWQIEDRPIFGYRGMQLDVGRNFHSVETIKRILDMMALYKLNKLHFHLTDDEGWRIEIPGLPELTDIGGRRGHTYTERECLLPAYGSGPDPDDPNSAGNGYYSREQYIDILRYAHVRHIEVFPAIDFPGHARAAIRAMEVRYELFSEQGEWEKANEYLLTDWYDESIYESVQMWQRNVVNVGLTSTYRFISKVVDELIAMYEEAGVHLTAIHTGGDEVPGGVWTHSPAVRKLQEQHPELTDSHALADYFLHRLNEILESRGLLTAGWEEIALTRKDGHHAPNPAFIEHKFLPYPWNNIWGWGDEDIPYRLANAGYNVVLCNATNLYFDFCYDKDPQEPGYYWGGYVDLEDTFRFVPFDYYQSADQDLFGRRFNPFEKYKGWTRPTEAGKKNILGIQGQLWGETILSAERIDYLLFPRMIALAERAWAKAPVWGSMNDNLTLRRQLYEQDWNLFANAIGQQELRRLDHLFSGVRYRLPLPGAVVVDGILYANVNTPGLTLRYTDDGTEPTVKSPIYHRPTAIWGHEVRVKAFSSNGRSSRTTLVKTPIKPERTLQSADLIPLPAHLQPEKGFFRLTPGTIIYVEHGNQELLALGEYLASKIRPATGFDIEVRYSYDLPVNGHIFLTSQAGDHTLGEEGYRLSNNGEIIILSANRPKGVFYGLQTLRQLLPPTIEHKTPQLEVWHIPAGVIEDKPRYAWRGFMLDVCRHFFSVAEVKRLIDFAAYYKINRFHLHLSDDQGWRIEIKSWPNLTTYGGSTQVDGGPGGYYTQEQYLELQAYAAERHIILIPEVDFPGHTNAALASYPELNKDGVAPELYTGIRVGFSSLDMNKEITYRFVEDVIRELAELTTGPYLHIGGDEAHVTAHEDYCRFIRWLLPVVLKHGKTPIGWEEVAHVEDPILSQTIVQQWNKDGVKDAVLPYGSKVIMSPATRTYLDIKYDLTTRIGLDWSGHNEVDHAYKWDPATQIPGITDQHILGVECALWTETVATRQDLDHLIFPRFLGLAEVSWSRQKQRSWPTYEKRLKAHLERLNALGIEYYKSRLLE